MCVCKAQAERARRSQKVILEHEPDMEIIKMRKSPGALHYRNLLRAEEAKIRHFSQEISRAEDGTQIQTYLANSFE